MTNETNETLMLVLCRGLSGSRLTVPLDTFLQFNASIDYELESLVDRWSDFAPRVAAPPAPAFKR